MRLFRPGDDPPQTPLTVRDVLALYLRHSAAHDVHTEEGRADRARTFELFNDALGPMPADEVKHYHLTDFIESQPTWLAPNTRRVKANHIKAAFNWAHETERIPRHPFRTVRYKEGERRPEMPDDALDTFARVTNKPYEQVLRFLRLTGCRLSELCQMTWGQVDLDRGVWLLEKHKGRKRTKRPKLIALVAEAVALLRGVRLVQAAHAVQAEAVPPVPPGGVAADAVGEGFVFLNNRGNPWTPRTLASHLWRLKRKLRSQTKASLHGIRHRFAGQAVANGAPIKLVAEQLGHASVQTTEKYYLDFGDHIEAIRDAARKGLPAGESLAPRNVGTEPTAQ